ncbi:MULTISPECIES: hypothetical protein [Pseudomonas]|uniref:hypothetical protein n=1 Tax=Pseudomonas TaxID=286 RepID=UPI000DB0C703|nr:MULTISPECIES: hypothetical protein [Pseudomonas]PZW82507.1 hypothetical protein DFS21_104303 [Pseudomonas sp. 2848]
MSIEKYIPKNNPPGVQSSDEEPDVTQKERLKKATPEDRDDYIDLDTISNEGPVPPEKPRASNAPYYTRQKLT